MVTTYAEWKRAILKEQAKLSDVSEYLNASGKERICVFDTLGNLSDFYATPEELLDWIETKENLDAEEIEHHESNHASAALNALRKIVRQ